MSTQYTPHQTSSNKIKNTVIKNKKKNKKEKRKKGGTVNIIIDDID